MAGLARGVLDAARAHGLELMDLVMRFGIEEATLDRADAFVPVELHEALWAELALRLGRDDVGVMAARDFRPGLTGVIEYHLRSCATVGEAVAAWVRFAPVVSDQLSSALEAHDVPMGGRPPMRMETPMGTSAVSLGPAPACARASGASSGAPPAPAPALRGPSLPFPSDDARHTTLIWRLARPLGAGTRHWAEFALGRAVRLIRDAVGTEIRPREVWFRHTAPSDTSLHRDYFGAPIHFGRPEHALVFETSLLAQRIRGFDPVAKDALAERAEKLRSELAQDFTGTCRATIRDLLSEPRADASLERVAERLSLSPRSIQRHLAESGLTFRRLSDEVRELEAQRLQGQLTPTELAARLGYADPAALRRARRRWTGRGRTDDRGDGAK